MPVKPFLLRVFVAAAETGTLQDAADRVGRSPAAVSMALKQLEDQIGAPLFTADRKSDLSELGWYLLETARDQLAGYDRAMEHVCAFAEGRLGRVDLACVPSVGSSLLPGIIKDFTTRWPGVELDVSDMDTVSVVRAVETGAVEIGIAGRPRRGAVTFRRLFRDRLVGVVAGGHALTEFNRSVPWTRLHDETIITNGIMAGSDHSEIQSLHDAAKMMIRNTTSLLAVVGSGVGITILPASAIPKGSPDVCGVDIGGRETVARDVGILRKPGSRLSPAATAFVETLEAHADPKQ